MRPSNNIQNHARHHFGVILALLVLISAAILVPGPAASMAGPAGPALSDYDCTQIDVPGAMSTTAFAINPRGDIAGKFTDNTNKTHGFVLDKKGLFRTIDVPGSTMTTVIGMNSEGDIVGRYDDAAGTHGYVLTRHNEFTSLQYPHTFNTFTNAAGINARGDIAGIYQVPIAHAYTLIDGVYTNIDPPGATAASAFGIGSSGEVWGNYIAAGVTHGFLLNGSDFTTINFPVAGAATTVRGVALGGYLVVGTYVKSAVGHGFLLADGAFRQFDYPGAMGTRIFGASENGDFVGDFNVTTNVTVTSGYVCH